MCEQLDMRYLDGLAKQLYTLMKGEELEEGLKARASLDRIGIFQHLIVRAIRESTLSCFNARPYYFNGRIYVPMTGEGWEAFNSLILRTADVCGLPISDRVKLEGVKKVCRGEVVLKTFEPDSSIIVLKNGVLRLEDNTFHAFDRRFKQVTQLDFDYNPKEYPSVWVNKFLRDVLDEDCQKLLQEYMGAIFVDRRKVKIEKMLILYGAGSNGKSVIQSTLIGLLGEDNVKTIGIRDLTCGSERKQNVASINGKRLNYCSEIQTREFGANSDALKALISGEPVEVRTLYMNNYTARNIPLLMANANKIPYIRDISHGLARRIIILPFEKIIEERNQNKMLARQLRREYAGILNWMLVGRERFKENGYTFSIPPKVRDLMEDSVANSSTVLRFMREKDFHRVLPDMDIKPKYLKAQALHLMYTKWCRLKGLEEESMRKFGLTLTEAGFVKRGTTEGTVYAVYMSNPRGIADVEYRKPNAQGKIQGVPALAHWLHIPATTCRMLLNQGVFEKCYTRAGRQFWFDLDKCRDALEKYNDEKKKKTLINIERERQAFNREMALKREPFRKAAKLPKDPGKFIYVRDEFNYDFDIDNYKEFIKYGDYEQE